MEKLGRYYLNQVIKFKVKPFIKGRFGNIKQSMGMRKVHLYVTYVTVM